MDNSILKKRLNTFKSANGKLTNVSDEVIMELLRAWEQWPGTSADLYRDLGLSKMQMVILLKKAKKLVKSGAMPLESDFKEIKLDSATGQVMELPPCSGVELVWEGGKVIRFSQVDLLLDFLKKVA